MPDSILALAEASEEGLNFILDLEPPVEDFRAAVLAGLSRPQKAIPPKYLYDERGSELFDALCAAPEYYIPAAETEILQQIAGDVAAFAGPNAAIIELGAGATTKISTLLNAMDAPALVVALDISREFLLTASRALSEAHPSVRVGAAVADFTRPIELPDAVFADTRRRLVFFPGSTIGNLDPDAATALLRTARSLVRPGDGFLIGVDLVKDRVTLESAYDDVGGATAAFELNVLNHINRELDGTIDTSAFAYEAEWIEADARVEMRLRAMRDLTFDVAGQSFSMTRGETIHTENSRKFTIPGFQAWASSVGFRPERVWTDAEDLFSVHLLEAV